MVNPKITSSFEMRMTLGFMSNDINPDIIYIYIWQQIYIYNCIKSRLFAKCEIALTNMNLINITKASYAMLQSEFNRKQMIYPTIINQEFWLMMNYQ